MNQKILANSKPNLGLIIFALWYVLVGCRTRTGEIAPRNHPITRIFVSNIQLSDSNSLSGLINLSWMGESASGYVRMYEILYDTLPCSASVSSAWIKTFRTDTTLLFRLPKGRPVAKVSFRVRSIDNHGLTDINPPCLDVPVKNASPVIVLSKPVVGNKALTDTVHSVCTLSWEASDEDGANNLDSVYIKFNRGPWIGLPKRITQITLVPTHPDAKDSTQCTILTGFTGSIYPTKTGFLKVNSMNKIYVRAKDISGAFSKTDSTNSFYYKQKTADVLVVNAYKSNADARLAWIPVLKDSVRIFDTEKGDSVRSVIRFDYFDMHRASDAYIPKSWNLTFREYLKLYNTVIWWNDLSQYESNLAIELGITAIQAFLDKGGKFICSLSKLPADVNSPIYQYAPFDSISSKPGQARLNPNTKIIPRIPLDTLTNATLITGATPGFVKATSKALYTATYVAQNNWSGPNAVIAGSYGKDGYLNQIYFSTDAHRLNGRPQAFKRFIHQIVQTKIR